MLLDEVVSVVRVNNDSNVSEHFCRVTVRGVSVP